jgi:hypothetical protein
MSQEWAMLESDYQAYLVRELRLWFKGCIILKNDSSYLQGVPDLTVLYRDKWAWLEVKTSKHARQRPNQVYYVGLAQEMSFGAFIYPENEEEVLLELQHAFES